MRKLLVIVIAALLTGSAVAQQLTTAVSSNPPTLDPQLTFNGFSFAVTNQIYETLVRVNADGEIVPGLAEQWSYPEPTTLQLKIREGVTFHDGTPLDASVVKASLDRLLDAETAAPGRFVVSAIDRIDVIDDYTLNIVTEPPFAPLLAHLSHPVTAVVPTTQADTLGRNPVGTGPFQFVSWQEGVAITLEAYPDYWGGAPEISEVVFRVIPEVSTQIIELRSGGLDIIFNVPPDNFLELQNEAGIETHSFLGWGSVHLGFNLDNPKLQDPLIRQAIAHAIDKELIVQELLQGLAEPAVSPIPPTIRFAADLEEAYPYDPERARQLLQEAGAENLSLRLDIFQSPELESIAQVLQFMLSEVGITLDIRTQEYPAYVEATQSEGLELYGTTWGTVTLDADYTLYAFFHSSQIPQNNVSRYRNEQVDAFLQSARETPVDEERAAAYLQVQQQVLQDLPMITIYYPYSTYAKREALNGESVNFSWINLDLRDATLTD